MRRLAWTLLCSLALLSVAIGQDAEGQPAHLQEQAAGEVWHTHEPAPGAAAGEPRQWKACADGTCSGGDAAELAHHYDAGDAAYTAGVPDPHNTEASNLGGAYEPAAAAETYAEEVIDAAAYGSVEEYVEAGEELDAASFVAVEEQVYYPDPEELQLYEQELQQAEQQQQYQQYYADAAADISGSYEAAADEGYSSGPEEVFYPDPEELRMYELQQLQAEQRLEEQHYQQQDSYASYEQYEQQQQQDPYAHYEQQQEDAYVTPPYDQQQEAEYPYALDNQQPGEASYEATYVAGEEQVFQPDPDELRMYEQEQRQLEQQQRQQQQQGGVHDHAAESASAHEVEAGYAGGAEAWHAEPGAAYADGAPAGGAAYDASVQEALRAEAAAEQQRLVEEQQMRDLYLQQEHQYGQAYDQHQEPHHDQAQQHHQEVAAEQPVQQQQLFEGHVQEAGAEGYFAEPQSQNWVNEGQHQEQNYEQNHEQHQEQYQQQYQQQDAGYQADDAVPQTQQWSVESQHEHEQQPSGQVVEEHGSWGAAGGVAAGEVQQHVQQHQQQTPHADSEPVQVDGHPHDHARQIHQMLQQEQELAQAQEQAQQEQGQQEQQPAHATDVEASALVDHASGAGHSTTDASAGDAAAVADAGSTEVAVDSGSGDQPQQAPAPATHTRLEIGINSPLGDLQADDVQKMVKTAQKLLYAEPSARNMREGLARLHEVDALVQKALHSKPVTRAPWPAPPPPRPAGGEGAVAEAPIPLPTRQPRSLGNEVATNRINGLFRAATATFQLAALRDAGLLPQAPQQEADLTPAAEGSEQQEDKAGTGTAESAAEQGAGPGASAGPSSRTGLAPRDPLATMVGLHQAAQAGSLEALMALADRHSQGVGAPASCPRGMHFAKVAAVYLLAEVEKEQRYAAPLMPVSLRDRHADGGYVAAEDAENGADVISLEEDMAMRGNPDAQRRMAYRRLVGRGMEADPEGAFHDFQAAAAQGDPYAIFNIGYMYLRGLFLPQNYTAAKEQFEQAAAKGLSSAYNGLGVLAWNGQGMPANLTAAREAFERGAALNNSDALYNLATMHYHGAGTPVNQSLAIEYFKRAYEHGHWRAPYMLALAHEAGAGVEPNCTAALKYMRAFFTDRSAWGDQLTAAVKLLDKGDTWGALVSYVLVAEQGSTTGAANAAWLLRRRAGYNGADADMLAARFFHRAARQGHSPSMVELGHMILAAAPPWTPPPPPPPPPPPAEEPKEPAKEESAKEEQPRAEQSPAEGGEQKRAEATEAASAAGSETQASASVQEAASGQAAGDTATAATQQDAAGTASATDSAASSSSAGSSTTEAEAVATSDIGSVTGSGAAAADGAAASGTAVEGAAAAASADGSGAAAEGAAAAGAAANDAAAGAAAGATATASPPPQPNTAEADLNNITVVNGTSRVPKNMYDPPPPPPLVAPGPLPTGRVVLGVTTADEAVAWYRAAAAAGDAEGLFYLGWATYHGLGTTENATFARLLWLRSFEVAGIRSNRAMAPLLALAGMRLDGWLAPVLGPHATARLYNSLERSHAAALAWARGSPLVAKLGGAASRAVEALQKLLLAAPEPGAGGSAGAGGEGETSGAGDDVEGGGGGGGRAGRQAESGIVALWGRFLDGVGANAKYAWRRVKRGEVAELAADVSDVARRWLGAGDSGSGSGEGGGSEGGAPPLTPGLLANENALMAAMTVALVVVLVVRRRRLAGRTA
ncbi:hypothetical protein HYH02_005836 [Chlamydomonas schloesseri]|uniref:Uncharacterized protein n=1 Tax=Chlamydomonas schloesseri TaxID=2026947 RepID=A0A835WKI2_9CHLO|nr:hypothetical protein HYH02_005836 [Chlamydomonas schloesseri]|eukprot:KAG2449087.1 hypothetical protein HYH02_005836 [Chlamydomonas schloesseri]